MLYSLGCLQYSPPLNHHIRQLQPIQSGHTWEIQLRGRCCIFLLLCDCIFSSRTCSTLEYLLYSTPYSTFRLSIPRFIEAQPFSLQFKPNLSSLISSLSLHHLKSSNFLDPTFSNTQSKLYLFFLKKKKNRL